MKALFIVFQVLIVGTTAQAQGGWTNRYSRASGDSFDEASAVSVNASGSVFVTGASSGDYATIVYSSGGIPLWTNRYDGIGNDIGVAVAVASNGSVVVCGTSQAVFNPGYFDYATVAYSGLGAPLWTNRYNGSGNYLDAPRSIAIDAGGNVFVTGHSWGFNITDYATVAYSSAGLPLWENRYGGPGNSGGAATAVAVGEGGNVFVTGSSSGVHVWEDITTIAYSNTGVPLWTNRYGYDGPTNRVDRGVAIGVDSSGKVFVGGYAATASGDDYVTLGYSSNGIPLWTNLYNGSGNSTDRITALAVAANGNVYVTGESTGNGSGRDYATVAYSDAGVPLWTNRYNGAGNTNDSAAAIAVDLTGNVFVTGFATVTGTNTEIVTIAYSSAGVPLRTNYYGGFGSGTNRATAIAVDNAGNVYVTGSSFGPGSGLDYVTIKYPSINATTPIQLLRPKIEGGEFVFFLQTDSDRNYDVQTRTNLTVASWSFVTSVVGDGSEKEVRLPVANTPEAYFRVVSD